MNEQPRFDPRGDVDDSPPPRSARFPDPRANFRDPPMPLHAGPMGEPPFQGPAADDERPDEPPPPPPARRPGPRPPQGRGSQAFPPDEAPFSPAAPRSHARFQDAPTPPPRDRSQASPGMLDASPDADSNTDDLPPEEPRLDAPPRGKAPLLFGIALNGVVFDPGTAEWWHNDASSGWHYDALGPEEKLGIDSSHAHVQPPTGMYHYHGLPPALLKRLAGDHLGSAMVQIGWAADGFPVYGKYGYDDPGNASSSVRPLRTSFKLKSGDRPQQADGPAGRFDGTFVEDYEYSPGSGDLDECNGRFGVTPEFPSGTYYYVVTDEFPFVPRSLRGVPDESFRKHPARNPMPADR